MPDLWIRAFYDGEQADVGMVRTAEVADVAGKDIEESGLRAGTKFGDAIDRGSSKAGNALKGLANFGSNWGLPTEPLSKFGEKLADTSTKSQKFGAVMQELGKVTLAATAVGFAAAAVEAIHMADGFDTAQSHLQTAIKNSGASWTAYKPKIDAAYSSLAKLGFENTDVAQALQQLTTATNDPSKALSLLGTAANVARMNNESLGDASGQLAKILGGNTRILAQWGINLDIGSGKLHSVQSAEEALQSANLSLQTTQAEVNDGQLTGASASGALAAAQLKVRDASLDLKQSQDAIADILDAVNQRTKGAAAAFGKTLPGEMDIARAEVHNLGVAFGEDLLPLIHDTEVGIASLIGWLEKNKWAVDIVAGAVAITLGGAIAAFVGGKVTSLIGGVGKIIASLQAWQLKHSATAAGIVRDDGTIVTGGRSMLQALQETYAQEIEAAQNMATRTTAAYQQTLDAARVAAENIVSINASIAKSFGSVQLAAGEATEGVSLATTGMVRATDTAAVGIDSALISTGIGAALVALGIAVDLLYGHWKAIWHDITVVLQGEGDNLARIMEMTVDTIVGSFDHMYNAVVSVLNEMIRAYNDTVGKMHVDVFGMHIGAPTLGAFGKKNASDLPFPSSSLTPWGTDQGLTWSNGSSNAPFALPKTPTPSGVNVPGYSASSPNTPGSTIPSSVSMPVGPSKAGVTPSESLTAGEIGMELVGTYLQGILQRTSAGGTGVTQQAGTIAAIRAEMANSTAVQALVNQLSATQNPTLVRMAQSITTDWHTMTEKLTSIQDSDLKSALSTIGTLQAAQNSASLATLNTDLTGVHKTNMERLVGWLVDIHTKASLQMVAEIKTAWSSAEKVRGLLRTAEPGAQALEQTLNLAGKGGTGITQQAGTVRALAAALTPVHQKDMDKLVSELKSVHSTTLTAMANTIQSDWATDMNKMLGIIDQDITAGQSKIATLQSAINSDGWVTLRTDITGIHKTQLMQLVTELRGVHTAAATNEANQLVAVFKATEAEFRDVQSVLYQDALADEIEKQAQALNAQTQKISDTASAQVTIAQDAAQKEVDAITAAATKLADAAQAQVDQVNSATTIAQDTSQKQVDAISASTTKLSDATQKLADAAAAQVAKTNDDSQKAQDAASAEVTAIQNAATKLSDAASAMVTSIQDATQAATDAANAQAAQITGQAQLQSDVIGQRGLYGLQLVAQQQKIALDQQQLIDQAAEAAAQAHLDSVTTQTNQAVAKAQAHLDAVTASSDAKAAKAQAHLDTVTLQTTANVAKSQQHTDAITAKTAGEVAKAQAHADSVTLHEAAIVAKAQAHLDTVTLKEAAALAKVQQHADEVAIKAEQAVARATAHNDQVAIHTAIAEAAAQAHVDAVQYGTKQQQATAQAGLKTAQAQGDAAEAAAKAVLTGVTDAANKATTAANNAYSQAQVNASKADQDAQNAYNLASANASKASQQAQNALNSAQATAALQNAQQAAAYQAAQNTANQQQAQAQAAYNAAQSAANKQQANANSLYQQTQASASTQQAAAQAALAQATNSATVIEAKLQAQYQVTQELANTEFAGSGLVVNIYGLAASDANGIADQFNFLARSLLVTPS